MPTPEAAIAYAQKNQPQYLEDLKTLTRIPSVSTLSEHIDDMVRTAEWLADKLRKCDFQSVEIEPTKRHPVVYGESLAGGPGAPTILVYGHYDVQPADPLEEWNTPPFEPTVIGENLYGRGTSDMKAQMVAFLEAVEAMVRTDGLPINLKIMVEGEEEIGSPNLRAFITEHSSLLASDFCLNTDSGIIAADTPSLTYALRGLTYAEIRLQGTTSDLHSGRFGGAVDNPAIVISRLIAGMRDADGRITLPGFYDNVRPLSEDERREFAKLPTTDKWWKEHAGAKALFGEPGYTTTERAVARPTLDVNGLYSGFIGEGPKTVLPARAMAKLSMRLVPDQTPEGIFDLLEAYLKANVPETMEWEMIRESSSPPGIIERDSKAVLAAGEALDAVWGMKPLFTREGGTIPVVGLIQEVLGLDTLMLGFGLPDDNIHAPNEKQHLPTLYRGIETYIRFAHLIADQG
ncbi:MAG: dipeptidase [Anaerolineales bacterium]|jgi:acetylornithine deacetylase/succinyl-diaminopimelate desuccinylase-like protein